MKVGKRILIIIVTAMVLTGFCVSSAVAQSIPDPKSISPDEALEFRIKEGYIERYCNNGGINKVAGYEYNSEKQMWLIKHSAVESSWINPRTLNETQLRHLLEYMYYVDMCADASYREIGALTLATGGVLAIITANPIVAIGGGIMIIAATIEGQIIQGDKDKCLRAAYELASRIQGI